MTKFNRHFCLLSRTSISVKQCHLAHFHCSASVFELSGSLFSDWIRKEEKRCPARDKCSPLPSLFWSVWVLFFGNCEKVLLYDSEYDKQKGHDDTVGGTRGRKTLFDFKILTFCVCLHEREHLCRPFRKQGKRNGHDYFPPFGSADIYGFGTHESHRDGQFAQMVAILGQHSNEKRGREKNGIGVSLCVHLSLHCQ